MPVVMIHNLQVACFCKLGGLGSEACNIVRTLMYVTAQSSDYLFCIDLIAILASPRVF